jgi:F0F1-type ATP synthase assembly protein I
VDAEDVSSPGRDGGDRRDGPQLPLGWARQYVLVLEFLAYLAVLGYLGARADERWHCQPWGLLGGLLLATAVGVYRMIREASKLER